MHMYIDHHIQQFILQKLSESALPFSKLKMPNIENSLYMYHLRKLISRNMVQKSNGVYQLTNEGARWCNITGIRLYNDATPRCLVQLLVFSKGQVLVSERMGTLGYELNTYSLPSKLHKHGATSLEIAHRAGDIFGVTHIHFVCNFEYIYSKDNVHSIIDIYTGVPKPHAQYPIEDDGYTLYYMPKEQVLQMSQTEAGSMPDILKRYSLNTLLQERVIAS